MDFMHSFSGKSSVPLRAEIGCSSTLHFASTEVEGYIQLPVLSEGAWPANRINNPLPLMEICVFGFACLYFR